MEGGLMAMAVCCVYVRLVWGNRNSQRNMVPNFISDFHQSGEPDKGRTGKKTAPQISRRLKGWMGVVSSMR